MLNSNKLKGRIKEYNLSQKAVAGLLELSETSFNQKINNIRPMNLDEAAKLQEILCIPNNEFGEYFFMPYSCAMQQN